MRRHRTRLLFMSCLAGLGPLIAPAASMRGQAPDEPASSHAPACLSATVVPGAQDVRALQMEITNSCPSTLTGFVFRISCKNPVSGTESRYQDATEDFFPSIGYEALIPWPPPSACRRRPSREDRESPCAESLPRTVPLCSCRVAPWRGLRGPLGGWRSNRPEQADGDPPAPAGRAPLLGADSGAVRSSGQGECFSRFPQCHPPETASASGPRRNRMAGRQIGGRRNPASAAPRAGKPRQSGESHKNIHRESAFLLPARSGGQRKTCSHTSLSSFLTCCLLLESGVWLPR